MKLKNYLALHAVKQKDFALKIGEKPACINNYCLGLRIPRPEIMKKIFIETGGLVTPNDFYDIGDSDANAAADEKMKGTVENV